MSTNTGNSLEQLARQRVWVLDVDDCLYRMDCRLHDRIKTRICDDANQSPNIKTLLPQWLGADRPVTPADLGTVFPKIVTAYMRENPAGMDAYLDKVYGDDYNLIAPSPVLVEAVRTAQDKGVRVVFYTNGPSSPDPQKDYHSQKVLKRLGFSEEFNRRARGNSYDLLMSAKAGRGKPTPEGMADFLTTLKVDPAQAVFFDDGLKNLKTGMDAGMKAVWTWTAKAFPRDADVKLALEMKTFNVRDTGAAFKAIADLIPRQPPAP